jgi:dTDP-4-dehydrorhamnose 3,5-epimerase
VRPEPTWVPGCVVLHLDRHEDERGDFVKAFRRAASVELRLDPTVAELYWSTSVRGVVRGLHFQLPPHEHAKTVTVVQGAVHDVVVDLRVGSPAFGRPLELQLSAAEPAALHVPAGCAHGFQSLEDGTIVAYLVGSEHAPDHDAGVRWDSVDATWPLSDVVVSERDRSFPTLAAFDSPFGFAG